MNPKQMSSGHSQPLVSVGLPTYNRVESLPRAIESVLSQSHSNLELVIADNASTDGTAELCRDVAATDARVQCLRQPVNQGFTVNLNAVIEAMRGDYLMLLADDDWLGPDYIATCLAALVGRTDVALVNGSTRSVRGEELLSERRTAHLTHPNGTRRVIELHARRHSKTGFYGLRHRAMQERVGPLVHMWGNDEIHLSAFAFAGKMINIPKVHYYKSVGGLSATGAAHATGMRLPAFQGRHPLATYTWNAATDIVLRSPVYRTLSLPARVSLAFVSLALYLDRRFGLRKLRTKQRTFWRNVKRLRQTRHR